MGVCGRLRRALRESSVSGPQVDNHHPTYPTLAVQTASVVGARDSIASRERLDKKQGEQEVIRQVQTLSEQNQALHARVQDLNRELTTVRGERVTRTGASMVDTRVIGKPEHFSGGSGWRDWSVLRAYTQVQNPDLTEFMTKAETTDEPVENVALSVEGRAASMQLYYTLIMVCRESMLTRVVNSGQGEGLKTWRALEIPRTYIGYKGRIIAHGSVELLHEWRSTGALGNIRPHDHQVREHGKDANSHDREGGYCPQATARVFSSSTPHLELGMLEHLRAAQTQRTFRA
eukprot:3589156-Amphidinium_carterae.1